MSERVKKFLLTFTIVIGTGIVTWLLSWAVQFFCYLTTPSTTFDLGSRDISRLAACTVLAVVVIMLAWLILRELSGCMLFIVLLLTGGAIVSGIVWVAQRVFVGTPVSAVPAQVVYGIITIAWSLGLTYIFFPYEDEEDKEVHTITTLP